MIELVCATANPYKAAEMAAMLSGIAVLLPRPEHLGDVAEDAADLEGNARLKARAVCRHASKPSLADDTGLEVDALGGAPGVLSARYAGPSATYAENTARLLFELRGVAMPERRARFRTVAVLCRPDGSEIVCEGRAEGRIALGPSGAGGFGYDSVFVPDGGCGRTFADMSGAEKHALSHRGQALRALVRRLVEGA